MCMCGSVIMHHFHCGGCGGRGCGSVAMVWKGNPVYLDEVYLTSEDNFNDQFAIEIESRWARLRRIYISRSFIRCC